MLENLEQLINTIREKKNSSPDQSYTNKLLTDKSLCVSKVKEEIGELIEAVEKNSNKFDTVIHKLTNTSTIKAVSEKVDGASFRVKSNEYFVPISIENIDIEAEINKLEGELKRAEGFLFGITKKLSNERFVANAPEQVITLERKKEADTKAKIETIKSSLKSLK